jgi:aldose 1-epimerase
VDSSTLLEDASARTLVAGDLRAVFLPGRGMLGASLRHRGEELLGRVEDLEAAARKGSTAGIPLLYPWANRLDGAQYAYRGRTVVLDSQSKVLHLDEHGLPIHGVPWAQLCWEVTDARPDGLRARLDWTGAELLAVFPFRHHVELEVELRPEGLSIETTVVASGGEAVPVSFGFHPYLALPGEPRAEWRLVLPRMRRLLLDARGIPTGVEAPFAAFDGQLGTQSLDDGFGLLQRPATFSVGGRQRRLSVELLSGYGYGQVFAPKDKPFVALEPMTAPTAALSQGRGLRTVEPGGQFRATFRMGVEWLSSGALRRGARAE